MTTQTEPRAREVNVSKTENIEWCIMTAFSVSEDQSAKRRELALDELAALRAKLQRYKKALEGLTPSGSEFVDEPERCATMVTEHRDSQHRIILDFAKRSKQAEEKLAPMDCGHLKAEWVEQRGVTTTASGSQLAQSFYCRRCAELEQAKRDHLDQRFVNDKAWTECLEHELTQLQKDVVEACADEAGRVQVLPPNSEPRTIGQMMFDIKRRIMLLATDPSLRKGKVST